VTVGHRRACGTPPRGFVRYPRHRAPRRSVPADGIAGGDVLQVKDASGNRIKETITGADGISQKSLDPRNDKGEIKSHKSIKGALTKHLNQLYAFEHCELVGVEVKDLRSKIMNISVGPGEPTVEQWKAINEVIDMAACNKIMVNVIRF